MPPSQLTLYLARFCRVVGCFDTVGSLGLPRSIAPRWESSTRTLLGFSDTYLGVNIQLALHALAIDEARSDFSPTKWHQTALGKRKGQVLKQV